MKRLHKLFALVLSLALLISCICLPAKAEDVGDDTGGAAGSEDVDTNEVTGTEDADTSTSEVEGEYTSGELTLKLGADGTFTMSGVSSGEVTGTFTYEKKNGWGGPSTNVTFDDESMGVLSAAGVMPWYSYVKLGDGTFTITKDVSMALVNNDDISASTVANTESKTGYTTTFTVVDNGYENVYAYGDWVAAYKTLTDPEDPSSYSGDRYTPDQWENGMDYCTSSIIQMEKGEDGNWVLPLNLASSVMGIACYHDVDEADLQGGLFPQKKSFYIPYDAEKQSESLDWSPAFPASENGNAAGSFQASSTESGIKLGIYTPYGYDANADTKYPVLYLIAGGGSTYESWFTQGMVGNIFDNLTAGDKAVPTVLVAMEFNAVSGDQLQEEVIPYIEANYNVYADAEHRSLAGVSMGSKTATEIWQKNPELFSYYAFLSGADKAMKGAAQEGYAYQEIDEEKLTAMKAANYFIGGGTTDFNMFEGDANSASVVELDAWMDHYGIEHNTKGDGNYDVAMGDHNWPIWMQLMIPYASEYLWQEESEAGGEDGAALELTVTSDILGLADTGNKSTLKQTLVSTGGPGDTALYYYNEEGQRVKYEDQDETHEMDPVHYAGSATLDLGDVDDSKIDSSKAVVKLVDGNGYYAEELIFNGSSTLSGAWENGKITYTLPETGALEWNNWDYYDGMDEDDIDYNSGREWSMMGGDGNGVYFFDLEVSGIVYDGQEVPAAKIPVAVYIYGRSSADLGLSTEFVENTYDENYTSGQAQSDEMQWSWYTENTDSMEDKPYMNDLYSDYFSAIWPVGTDASGITAEDVTVTLRSEYGNELVLSEKNAYGEQEYAVISHNGETEIIVTYQQWAYVPVYSTMEIVIDNGTLKASKTYDISSVGTYLVQTGGGGVTVDHTVTAYNHYGISGMTLDNAVNKYYTLSVKMEDGTTKYYAEDEDGKAYLADAVEVANPWGFGTTAGAPDEAAKFDGTEKYHLAVHNNVVYVETRLDNAEVKVVDGEEITFTQNISATISDAEIIANGASLEPGYNLVTNGADKWAWTFRYQSGWTTDSAEPTALPYASVYPYGYEAGTAEEDMPYYGMEVSAGPGGPGSGGPGTGGPGGDIDDPGTEEPGTDDPGTEEPGIDNPGTEEPGIDNPGTEEPGADNPGTEEPGSDNPGAEEPGIENPDTGESGTDIQNPGEQAAGSEAAKAEGTSQSAETDSPKTGDTSNVVLWIVLLVAAASAVCTSLVLSRKKRR